jgi:hypothetical protein
METLRSLFEKYNKPIFNRIENQFGNLEVSIDIDPSLSNSEIFRRVTHNKGKGKPHSSNNYPKNEGKKKFT